MDLIYKIQVNLQLPAEILRSSSFVSKIIHHLKDHVKQFHRNDIFRYIYDNGIEIFDAYNQSAAYRKTRRFYSKINLKKLSDLRIICVSSSNYEVLLFLESEGIKINDNYINEAAKVGNLFLVRYFLENNQIPKDILVSASKSGNTELVKFIIDLGVNINAKDI